jgi:hypothetical protein
MPTLYSAIAQGPLYKLFPKAKLGDRIELCEKEIEAESICDPVAHPLLGVLWWNDVSQRPWAHLNDTTLSSRYATQHLGYFSEPIFRQGNRFYRYQKSGEKLLYEHKGHIWHVRNKPDGSIVIFADEQKISIIGKTQWTKSDPKVETLTQPWDKEPGQLGSMHIWTSCGNKFYRDGQEMLTLEDWKGGEWWEYGDTIATGTNAGIETIGKEMIHKGSSYSRVICCQGKIVVDIEHGDHSHLFSVNGRFLPDEYQGNQVIESWMGPILEWKNRFYLVAVK